MFERFSSVFDSISVLIAVPWTLRKKVLRKTILWISLSMNSMKFLRKYRDKTTSMLNGAVKTERIGFHKFIGHVRGRSFCLFCN